MTDVTGKDADAGGPAKMQGLPLARLGGTKVEADQIGKLVKASGSQADAWLARLHFELGLPGMQRHAQSALADPQLAGQDLCHVLFLLADSQFVVKAEQGHGKRAHVLSGKSARKRCGIGYASPFAA